MHPKIATSIENDLRTASNNQTKARALFSAMFERKNSVHKGRFAQELARVISAGASFQVPDYIRAAIEHACTSDPYKQ